MGAEPVGSRTTFFWRATFSTTSIFGYLELISHMIPAAIATAPKPPATAPAMRAGVQGTLGDWLRKKATKTNEARGIHAMGFTA